MCVILSGSSLFPWLLSTSAAFRTLCALLSTVVCRCSLGFGFTITLAVGLVVLNLGSQVHIYWTTYPVHLSLLVLIIYVVIAFICKALCMRWLSGIAFQMSPVFRYLQMLWSMSRRRRLQFEGWAKYEACFFRVFARLGSSVCLTQLTRLTRIDTFSKLGWGVPLDTFSIDIR